MPTAHHQVFWGEKLGVLGRPSGLISTSQVGCGEELMLECCSLGLDTRKGEMAWAWTIVAVQEGGVPVTRLCNPKVVQRR